MTEFWHMFLQDSMTQKGSGVFSNAQTDIVLPPRQEEPAAPYVRPAQINPIAVMFQVQQAQHEQQMQGMYLQIQTLNNQVSFLMQQLQQSAMYHANQFQNPLSFQNYLPWTFHQPLYYSNSQPSYFQTPYYETNPPAKDYIDIMTESVEKATKFRNAMNNYRNPM